MSRVEFVTEIEVGIFALGALVCAASWHQSLSHFLFFMGAIVYGFILEILTILAHEVYEYGQFHVMAFGVPISIAVGWGCIIYACFNITERSSLKSTAMKSFTDALLAVVLDLAMDPVAVKFGCWVWKTVPSWAVNYRDVWFGVPYGNFFGWYFVVLSYTLFARYFFGDSLSFSPSLSFAPPPRAKSSRQTSARFVANTVVRAVLLVLCSLILCNSLVLFMATALKGHWSGSSLCFWGLIGLTVVYLLTSGARYSSFPTNNPPSTTLTFILFQGWFFALYLASDRLVFGGSTDLYVVLAVCAMINGAFVMKTTAVDEFLAWWRFKPDIKRVWITPLECGPAYNEREPI